MLCLLRNSVRFGVRDAMRLFLVNLASLSVSLSICLSVCRSVSLSLSLSSHSLSDPASPFPLHPYSCSTPSPLLYYIPFYIPLRSQNYSIVILFRYIIVILLQL